MRPEQDADPQWVSSLTGLPLATCERSLAEARAQRSLFRHIAREHQREGRRSYVEIDAPLELHALVRLRPPRHIVEVGVSSGVSSAYLLHALAMNGRGTLHSVDLPSHPSGASRRPRPSSMSWSLPPGRSSGWAVPRSLRSHWDLRLGDKADVLPALAVELSRLDLLVYDVPHDDRQTSAEFRDLAPRLSPGGVVIVDHGPHGGLCSALRAWARRVGAVPARRRGLGLYAFRNPVAHPAGRRRGVRRAAASAGRKTGRSGASVRALIDG